MSAPQVVGIGLSTLDILVRLEKMPTWEDASSFSDCAIDGGGPVATAMVAVSRLGVSAGYIGTAGTDESGHRKVQSLIDNKVDVSQMQRIEGPEKAVIICLVDSRNGERYFMPRQGSWTDRLDCAILDREYITGARFLHLDGFHYEAALEAAKWMRGAGGRVVYDGGKTKRPVGEATRELMKHIDILICGEGFVQGLTGISTRREAMEKALNMGPETVVQTEGGDGCYTMSDGDFFHTPSFDVQVVDTTGAGDVFHGGYMVALLHGFDKKTAALFSSAVSAINCTRLGGRHGIPTFEETTAFLQKHGIGIGSL